MNTGTLKKPLDLISIRSFALGYLFLQLFATPLLYYFFPESPVFNEYLRQGFFAYTQNYLIIAASGFLFFMIGLLINPLNLSLQKSEHFNWTGNEARFFFWSLFLFGFFYKIVNFAGGGDITISNAKVSLFNPVVTYFLSLNWFHILSLAVLCVYYYETQKHFQKRSWLYIAVLSFFIINGAVNGATSFVIVPVAIHLAVRQFYAPIKPTGYVLGAFLVISFIYLKFFMKVLILDDPENKMHGLAGFSFLVYRINLASVISEIAENSSFSYGYGLLEQLFWSLRIPYFDYAASDGNKFAHYYSLIGTNDFNTGIAISNLGDLLLHLGPILAVGCMFFLGCLYSFINSFQKSENKILLVIYAMLWPVLIHGLESPISVLIGAIVKLTLFITLTYLLYLQFLKLSKKFIQ